MAPLTRFRASDTHVPLPFVKGLDLAYIHVVESRISGNADIESTDKVDFALDIWGKTSPVLIAGGFKPHSAKRAVDDEYRDRNVALVFGRYYISNPDLPFRLKNDVELTKSNRTTFYKAQSTEGYTDYPFSKEYETSSRLERTARFGFLEKRRRPEIVNETGKGVAFYGRDKPGVLEYICMAHPNNSACPSVVNW
jgi:hypothetical protein